MQTLAINGGYPVRSEKLYYGRQWIDESDVHEVVKTLYSDFITCGGRVDEAERTLEELLSVRHAVVVSNGTAALHCACIAAGLKEGDEVITTPLTFAASANCAFYCGAKPVFADVDMETYNIDPKSIEEHITDHTKAVIAVDFTGQAVKHREIREICDRHGLIFIEDAAHAIGTLYDGRPVGSLADMTCFSFHPVKTVTSGEGGAVTTNSDELYKKLVLAHTHGITHEKTLMKESQPEGPWYYEQISLGYNYRMTDFQAALLVSQLNKLESFKNRRKEISCRYDEELKKIPEITVQKEIPESDTCRHLYIIRLNEKKLNCTRRQFYDALAAEGIQCQVHYVPVYWFPYYQEQGYKRGECPNAEKIYHGIMSLPLYPKMSNRDVEDVINAVKKVVAFYRRDVTYCLGTVQFGMEYGIQGNKQPEYGSVDKILEYALANGIDHFDCATAYGEAEEVLGHHVRHYRKSGKRMHIISKLSANMLKEKQRARWKEIMLSEAEKSRVRLGTDQLDAWLFHNASLIHDKDALVALDAVRQKGIAKKVGVSVYTPEEGLKSLDIPIIQVIQIPYNVFDQRWDKCGFFEKAMEKNVEVYVRSTLLQGLLTMEPTALADDKMFLKPYLEKYREICVKYGVTPLDAALGYVKAHKGIDYIVFGVDNLSQLKGYIGAAGDEMPEEMWKEFEEAFQDVEERVINPSKWK